jgi:hypothetical protein
MCRRIAVQLAQSDASVAPQVQNGVSGNDFVAHDMTFVLSESGTDIRTVVTVAQDVKIVELNPVHRRIRVGKTGSPDTCTVR